MSPARSAALVVCLLATVAAAAGCSDGGGAVPAVVPSDVHLASSAAATPAGPSPRRTDSAAASPSIVDTPGARRLDAARTVALYCHLIDAAQFARAGELCAHRHLWSRRVFSAVARFRFRSASVYAAPDLRTLVLRARVRVHARRGRPFPDGLAILFFTLGRAGGSVGGWLISAVSSSP